MMTTSVCRRISFATPYRHDLLLDIASRFAFLTHPRIHHQDDDSFWGVDQKTSTRFDHNFSITDFVKINLGTKVALRLVSPLSLFPRYLFPFLLVACAFGVCFVFLSCQRADFIV